MKRKLLVPVVFMVMTAVGLGTYLGWNALTDGTASAQDGERIHVKYSYAVEFHCSPVPVPSDLSVAFNKLESTIHKVGEHDSYPQSP